MTSTVEALQTALQGEYAAVFGYGQAAGPLRGAQLDRARRDLDAHRSRRDRLRASVRDSGATPVAPESAYVVPPTPNAAAARTALAGIEQRLAVAYANLVGASTGATRALAVAALSECTVRAAAWGGDVPEFPGLPERTTG